MQQNFLDGTPCSDFGTCNNGQCDEPSALKQVELFAHKYKAKFAGIVIGVAVVAIILFYLCYRCCCAAKKVSEADKAHKLAMKQYNINQNKTKGEIYQAALARTGGGTQDAFGNWTGSSPGAGYGRGGGFSPGGQSITAPSYTYYK